MAEIFFLIILAGVGGWILYEDVKKGRIRNSLLLVLIGGGIFLNYYTGSFAGQPFFSLTNIFFGIAVGLIIWLAGLWSAADAKLFISLVVLFPIIWFKPPSGYFPGLAILVNSTLPLFLILIGQVLFQSNRKEKAESFKKILKPSLFVNIFVIGMGILLLRSLMASFLNVQLDYFLTLPLFLGLFWLVGKLKIKMIYISAIIIVFSLIFSSYMFDPRFLLTVLGFTLVIFFTIWIISLSQSLFTRQEKVSDLKEGMILNEMILEKDKHFVKQPMAFLTFLTSLAQRMGSKPIFGYNPDGLRADEIRKLQEMRTAGQLEFETIGVAKTLPFAQTLFLGIIMTYFLKGSIFAII